ncbi:MAG TPA: hypothetical protein PLP16_12675 [Smithellaceae bacterium]|nr:hypothetical protein [Smithellaceae bacterium]
MKIFQVVAHANTVPLFYNKTGRILNVLISNAYQEGNLSKLTKAYRPMIGDLYLDSGAYSVFTGAKKISRHQYMLLLKKYGDLFTERFSLDDRFDDSYHNLLNQLDLEEKLKDKSWKTIPVIHDFADPYGEFEMYVNYGHTYVALGSMGARKKIPLEILGKIRTNYPHIKIHMFGTLNFDMLKKYRPYSADSAGWAHEAGSGGSISYWRPSENKGYTYNMGGVESVVSENNHVKKSPFYEEIEQFWRERFGFTYNSLLSDANERFIVNLYFFTQVEDYLNSIDPLSDNAKQN